VISDRSTNSMNDMSEESPLRGSCNFIIRVYPPERFLFTSKKKIEREDYMYLGPNISKSLTTAARSRITDAASLRLCKSPTISC
jgi:hypothetical protein